MIGFTRPSPGRRSALTCVATPSLPDPSRRRCSRAVADQGPIGAKLKRVMIDATANVALGAVIEAARELLDEGTYGYWDGVAAARSTITTALST